MEVRWFRSQFSAVVHLYRDGQDQYAEQMLEYRGRTELLRDDITNGRVSLRIRDIQLSDKGQYTCFFQSSVTYEEALLELQVAGLGSDPNISVEGHQDGGIRVVCRSSGWYPEPEAQWRDLQGQLLPSASENISQEAGGLFQTEIAIVLTEESNQKVSCCIRNPQLNQERESAISIAGWRSAQLYAVDVTLDPNTAHPNLILSEDQKTVTYDERRQDLPDNPERFNTYPTVLGANGFTGGRFYWEVEVGDKTNWTVGEKIQAHLKSLREEREKLLRLKVNGEKRSQEYLIQTQTERQKIVSEFQQLRQFLEEQERHLLAQLEKLEKEIPKIQNDNASKLSEEISCLSNLISELEGKGQEPGVNSCRCEKGKFQQPVEISPELEKRLDNFSQQTVALMETLRKFKGRTCLIGGWAIPIGPEINLDDSAI
ncbi:hypothetical protein KIL84_012585 [Mauremys mutica]|uniref:Uncharacterized protein n=1 Tax=Mauremys mutica TaxID=74926 RepID=A0A9D3XNB3_9SAUR|nr:hypothetical protein KIL84_012585 [Mauremys mutica]